MKNILIGKDNINFIMDFSKDRTVIDQEFLEALWQYALYSRNISRIAPECKICSKQGNHGDFTFEGYNVPIDVDMNFDPNPILWTLENTLIPIRGHQTVPLL